MVLPSLTDVTSVGIDVRGDTAFLDLNMVLENKAPYGMHVQSITYDLKLDERTLVSEEHHINLDQEAGEIDTISLEMHLPHKHIGQVIKEIQSQDSTKVGAQFSITYDTFFGTHTIPSSYSFNIRTPVPPKVELNRIKLGFFEVGQNIFQLFIDLDIINENEFGMRVKNLEYEAEFGDNLTGRGKADDLVELKKMGRTNVELPIVVDVDRPMQVIWKIITNKDRMDYHLRFKGILFQDTADQKNVPFDIEVNGNAELVKKRER